MIPPSTSNGEIQRRLDTRTYPVTRQVAEVAVPDEDRAAGSCESCPHPWSSHDRISVRFCTATKDTGTSRSCVCPTEDS
ncbi:RGCVC family protein [Actinocrispum sp. NPDC049592]|uniref:RGCVC family protein n=1 Tax=Actinocrispum sp. NPDC049592 TaxID=3154835 RepID=UPI00342B9F0A